MCEYYAYHVYRGMRVMSGACWAMWMADAWEHCIREATCSMGSTGVVKWESRNDGRRIGLECLSHSLRRLHSHDLSRHTLWQIISEHHRTKRNSYDPWSLMYPSLYQHISSVVETILYDNMKVGSISPTCFPSVTQCWPCLPSAYTWTPAWCSRVNALWNAGNPCHSNLKNQDIM